MGITSSRAHGSGASGERVSDCGDVAWQIEYASGASAAKSAVCTYLFGEINQSQQGECNMVVAPEWEDILRFRLNP